MLREFRRRKGPAAQSDLKRVQDVAQCPGITAIPGQRDRLRQQLYPAFLLAEEG
jgi:hypothetical protein